MNALPLNPPTGLTFEKYTPLASASAHVRLRCMLCNVLSSPALETTSVPLPQLPYFYIIDNPHEV